MTPNRDLRKSFSTFFVLQSLVFFNSHSNEIKNSWLRIIWLYPKKNYFLLRKHAFLKYKYFAHFSPESKFKKKIFHFFRTSGTFFSISTLTNLKNFSLHIVLLYPKQNYLPEAWNAIFELKITCRFFIQTEISEISFSFLSYSREFCLSNLTLINLKKSLSCTFWLYTKENIFCCASMHIC